MSGFREEQTSSGDHEQPSGSSDTIEPGMVVETTDADLGERDVSKPTVRGVVRDEHGEVEKLTVEKGLIFRKEIEIPANRIRKVQPEPTHSDPRGEVTIAASDDEVSGLRIVGTEELPPLQSATPPEPDPLDGLEEAQPTAEGMRRREGRNELADDIAPPRVQETSSSQAEWRSALLRTIGPGFLSGMSGNDPSAITSYAINGAATGFGQLWLLLLATPMYQAVIYACGKIGRITGHGLSDVLREHYGSKVAAPPAILLLIGNVALIAADLSAVGSGLELITGVRWIWFVLPIALLLWYITVFQSFGAFKKVFVILSLAFITYIITAVLSHPSWSSVLRSTFVPSVNFGFAGISAAMALLGATISPYSMFWQSYGETEEQRQGSTKQQVRASALDVASGTISGNLIAYSVIVSTSATLYLHHQQITTAADAARGLEPLLGPFAKYLFAIGLIGAGVVAIPVLLASTSYAISGTFGWHASLWHKPWQNEGFYLILTIALLASLGVAFLGVSPIQLMFYANILQAVLAPVLVAFVILVGNSRAIMRGFRFGWLTNMWLIFTIVILVVASVLLFYGLATGQAGG